jgi:hypothetical protein
MSSDDDTRPDEQRPQIKGGGLPVAVPPSHRSQDGNGSDSEALNRADTARQAALFVWAQFIATALLVEKMSSLAEEIIGHGNLDDLDDEEDEDFLADHKEQERTLLEKVVTEGLKLYPTIDAIKKASEKLLKGIPDDDSGVREELMAVLAQLQDTLNKKDAKTGKSLDTGKIKIADKFTKDQLQNRVRSYVKALLNKKPNIKPHIRSDVPGTSPESYGQDFRVSSLGVFARMSSFEEGGGLVSLLRGGWERISRTRIDHKALSYEWPARTNWKWRYQITDKDGHTRLVDVPAQNLSVEDGGPAIKQLMAVGVQPVVTKPAKKALAKFLRWRPKARIRRVPSPGWWYADTHRLLARSDDTLLPPTLMKAQRKTKTAEDSIAYELDHANDPDHYGGQLSGTLAQWQSVIERLRGNSNIALALATSFASPLLHDANEQRGGFHLYGTTGIAKSFALAVGESVYGLPSSSGNPRAFGRGWAATLTGFETFMTFRNYVPLFLDELKRSNSKELVPMVYLWTQTPKLRGGQWRKQTNSSLSFLLSTGEIPLSQFVDKSDDAEGRQRRLPDIRAEVREGSALETISLQVRDEIIPEWYRILLHNHGHAGKKWQQCLVDLGEATCKARVDAERKDFLALPGVKVIAAKVRPQMRSVINRLGTYAASLRMAISAEILPWTVEEADQGMLACMDRWLEEPGITDAAGELMRGADRIWATINNTMADCFIGIKNDNGHLVAATAADQLKLNAPDEFDGYVKGDRVLVRPEAWHRLCDGVDANEMAEQFRSKNWLIADEKGGKLAKKERVPGGKTDRFYVLVRHRSGNSGAVEQGEQQ